MRYRRAWIALIIVAILTPLGIIAAGGAWGEWGIDAVKERAGFVPAGMRSAAGAAERPLQDYTVPGFERGFLREGLGTIVAALLGAGVTAGAAIALMRIAKHGDVS
ncbi:MAG: PDGLE domain-containing protein [Candidatus Krumholzibacteriaceae bacterium]|jgi:cobalt/nickel transport protein